MYQFLLQSTLFVLFLCYVATANYYDPGSLAANLFLGLFSIVSGHAMMKSWLER